MNQSSPELLNGTRLEVDAVIVRAGYQADFSIMADLEPTCTAATSDDQELKVKVNSIPLNSIKTSLSHDTQIPLRICALGRSPLESFRSVSL